MIDLNDIISLTDFKRDTNKAVKNMKKSKRPLVLTVKGKAELVVHDAHSYQAFLDLIERMQTIEGVREGYQDLLHGRVQDSKSAFKEISKTLGIK